MAAADTQQLKVLAADTVFNEIDANHDGVITKEEFMRSMQVKQAPAQATPMQQYISQPPVNVALAQDTVTSPVPIVTYSAAPPVRVQAQFLTAPAASAPLPSPPQAPPPVVHMGPSMRMVPVYGNAPPLPPATAPAPHVVEVDYTPPKREVKIRRSGTGMLYQAMEHPGGDLFSPFENFEEDTTVDVELLKAREMHAPKVPDTHMQYPSLSLHGPNVSAPHVPSMHAPNMPSMHAPNMHAPHFSAPNLPSMQAPSMPDMHVPKMPSAHDPVHLNWPFEEDPPRVNIERRAIDPAPQQYTYASTAPYAAPQPVMAAPSPVPVVTYSAPPPVRAQPQYINATTVTAPAPQVAPAGMSQTPTEGLFEAMDLNSDGVVTRGEFLKFVGQMQGRGGLQLPVSDNLQPPPTIKTAPPAEPTAYTTLNNEQPPAYWQANL